MLNLFTCSFCNAHSRMPQPFPYDLHTSYNKAVEVLSINVDKIRRTGDGYAADGMSHIILEPNFSLNLCNKSPPDGQSCITGGITSQDIKETCSSALYPAVIMDIIKPIQLFLR